MIDRRALLAGGAFAFAGACMAGTSRVKLPSQIEQGRLVVGNTEPGARLTLDGEHLDIGESGAFAFGFAFDRTKPATLAATFADGATEALSLTPIARQYEIQRITGLPEKLVTLPPEVLERRKREIAMIAEARRRDSDVGWFAEVFDWPVTGIVSGPYGNQRILNGVPRAPHLGVDIAAPAGSQIHAPIPAIVSLAEPDFYLEGGLTILDHGRGISTCYLHQSKQLVKAGDKVARGDVIGLVGMTGRATGPHLHWGLNWFQLALDPSLSARTSAPPKA